MPNAGLYIVRKRKITLNPAFETEKDHLLKQVGVLLQTKARAEASRPSGLGLGVKSGKLVAAIQVKGPYTSGSGKSTVVNVQVDQEMAPHAVWQEHGTGIYGPTGEVIRPKTAGGVMAWVQTGRPYVGYAVSARLIKRGKHAMGNQYQQYAKWVKGVKPKHFMQKARQDPTIAKLYREGGKRLAKTLIKVV
jgi:hypothetical protein